MVNPIIKFGIPIVGIITVGLFLRQAFGSSLGQAGWWGWGAALVVLPSI